MPVRSRLYGISVAACLILCASLIRPVSGQSPGGAVALTAGSPAQLRASDQRVDSMLRTGELRRRQTDEDPLVPGRTHERADQYYRGVRVFGADIARQLRDGATESLFGTIYEGIALDPAPGIDETRARVIIEARAGVESDPARTPELLVLPLEGGGYALTWRLRVTTRRDSRQYFIDARAGAAVLDYTDRKMQTAVGKARGVLGDTKKISVRPVSGQFQTADELRPPMILTYDMQGNPNHTDDFLNGKVSLSASELGTDADNDWTDAAIDDAHVYAGYTYDYYFKRFGRHGLNNSDLRMRSLVHPVHRADLIKYFNQFPDFFVNAFYDGDGIMVYGEGLSPDFSIDGQTYDFFAGALDIVAHELTHGVTEFTSNLIYFRESGALNESFSDIMGTSAEFFFQPPGGSALQADYLIGEDVIRPGGIRSMSNPGAFGDPDHYSKRYLGPEDNGGVHTNSGISNQAFYLAIEGGTNRTSGRTVQGVGGANREQIEKVFYRAFTQLMPSNSTFAVARAATIQASRDLYAGNAAVERAVTDAWTAVGVN